MNEIRIYADVAVLGMVVVMAIPLFLFLLPFALAGYIICKILKISPDEIRYFDYE